MAVRDEILGGGQATREGDRRRVAGPGLPVDVRPTGEGQAEQPGHLVERLAGRVVDGGAQRGDAPGQVVDQQQRRVAAGDQQRDRRLGQRAVLQRVHGDVRGEMVDPVDRLFGGDRVPLGRSHPDQQRPGQTGAGGDRDRVDVGERHPRLGQRPPHRRHNGLQVRPAGHLRHHPTESGVLVHARRERVGEQGVPAHDTDAGLVARGLDAEDQWFVSHGRSQSWVRCMTSASVLLGW